MKSRIDRKHVFMAISTQNGMEHTHEDGVIFLAKDNALPATLRFYRRECWKLGAERIQLRGIGLLIQRVEGWQRTHRDCVKVADIDPVLGKKIVAPNRLKR